METILIAAPPLILGLVQAARAFLSDRMLPLASLLFGFFVVALFAFSGQIAWKDAPLASLMSGLAASGLYSGARTTLGAK